VRFGLALALCAGVLLAAASASAQERQPRFQFGGYGGYLFGSSVEGTSNALTRHASLEGAPSYGGFINVAVRPNAFAEVSYTRSPTRLSLNDYSTISYRYDVVVQYLQIGGLLEFPLPKARWFRPTFGGTLGATVFTADDQGFTYDEWRFSMIFEGGAKLQPNEHFGVRLRARLGGTFLTDDSALFCVAGACAVAYSGTALLQVELGAGAYLSF
jgi:hypothetical protein